MTRDAQDEEIEALHARAVERYEAGDDRAAVTLLTRARRQSSGPSPTALVARTVLLLDEAAIHAHCQRFRRAAACYERAAATVSALDPGAAALRYDALERLGDTYRVLGRYEDARATTLLALRAAHEAYGAESHQVGCQLNNLGVIEKARSKPRSAVRYYQRALALFERVLGPDHLEIANVLHNLGGIAHARGQFALGEPFARRGLEIRERALGKGDPIVAADRVALASLIDGQGRHDEAEVLYREALAVLEATLGDEHYDVASTLRNLAVICERRGDRAQAQAMFERALAIKRKLLGHHHPEVATLLHDLALLHYDGGRRKRATDLMARARHIVEKTLPEDHPVRARTTTSETALREAIARAKANGAGCS